MSGEIFLGFGGTEKVAKVKVVLDLNPGLTCAASFPIEPERTVSGISQKFAFFTVTHFSLYLFMILDTSQFYFYRFTLYYGQNGDETDGI